MSFYRKIEIVLSETTGQPFNIEKRRPIGGGCVSAAECLSDPNRSYFLKTNRTEFLGNFEAETDSLDSLAATATIRIPKPIASGIAHDRAYLLLEYIQPGSPNTRSWSEFGRQLAALHKTPQPYFGWHRDNAIGTTLQSNLKSDDWISFLRDERLRPQIDMARYNGFILNGADRLFQTLPGYFENHSPWPSLLHGDLWSGNAAFDQNGQAFIFDPCCYFGDRETDLAFTEFFGGYPSDFYASYQDTLPYDSGYDKRKTLYNLYHCLNHYNLFGSSYAAQAQAMTDELLS